MYYAHMGKKAVIAIGGNSILPAGRRGTISEQFANTIETVEHIADMIMMGYDLVITHGNGPQVGNMLLRSEKTEDILYPLPLDICDSNTQGSMGYMIQQALGNVLKERKIKKEVVTLVTQVVVDRNDSAFKKPTKPIGPFYSKEKAEKYRKDKKWEIAEDAGRGYRRVVPSPEPLEIVENEIIKKLIGNDIIVIAVGGGGIPVVSEKNRLSGVEAVIDKDLASSLLASNISAELLNDFQRLRGRNNPSVTPSGILSNFPFFLFPVFFSLFLGIKRTDWFCGFFECRIISVNHHLRNHCYYRLFYFSLF